MEGLLHRLQGVCGDGRGWKGVEGDGRGWKEMEGDGRGWKGMDGLLHRLLRRARELGRLLDEPRLERLGARVRRQPAVVAAVPVQHAPDERTLVAAREEARVLCTHMYMHMYSPLCMCM